MKEITLESGLKLTIDLDRLNDMELVDLLADAGDGDPVAITRAATKMLGKKQKAALYDSLRNEEGRVPAAAFAEAFNEIFKQLGTETKN